MATKCQEAVEQGRKWVEEGDSSIEGMGRSSVFNQVARCSLDGDEDAKSLMGDAGIRAAKSQDGAIVADYRAEGEYVNDLGQTGEQAAEFARGTAQAEARSSQARDVSNEELGESAPGRAAPYQNSADETVRAINRHSASEYARVGKQQEFDADPGGLGHSLEMLSPDYVTPDAMLRGTWAEGTSVPGGASYMDPANARQTLHDYYGATGGGNELTLNMVEPFAQSYSALQNLQGGVQPGINGYMQGYDQYVSGLTTPGNFVDVAPLWDELVTTGGAQYEAIAGDMNEEFNQIKNGLGAISQFVPPEIANALGAQMERQQRLYREQVNQGYNGTFVEFLSAAGAADWM